jgi:hypothetical protein
MASKLKFDEPEARAPAGPPSVPISSDNLDRSSVGGDPAAPVSSDNLDRRTLKFDAAPETEGSKSLARIRDIAGQMKAGAPYTPGPIDYIADSASLSTTRPLSAFAGAASSGLLGSYPGSSFGERYKAGVEFMNDRMAQAEKNTGPIAPVVGGLAQLPATMAMPGVRGATAPASTIKAMGQSAAAGGIEGASQHAGSVSDAVEGGVKNAALSAGVTGVLDKGMKAALPAAKRGAAAEAEAARGRSPDDIKAEARTFYQDMDNAGVRYDASQTAPLYTALHDMRNTARYSEAANPALRDHFDNLLRMSRNEMSYTELQNMRSAISEQTRSPDSSTRRAAGDMLGEIDRVVRSPPAINPTGIDMADTHSRASGLWRAASLADDAGWVADKTERKMAVNSNTDPDKTTRGNFARVEERINKPGAHDPFDDRGRELLSRIVRGDKLQNTQAAVGDTFRGRFAPWAGGAAGLAIPTAVGISKNVDPILATALGGVAGATVAGGVNQAGKAFQRGAASRGTEHVNEFLRHVSGSPPPTPGAAINRDDLVKILFAQDLERMAPRVGSKVIGEPDEDPKKKKQKEKAR